MGFRRLCFFLVWIFRGVEWGIELFFWLFFSRAGILVGFSKYKERFFYRLVVKLKGKSLGGRFFRSVGFCVLGRIDRGLGEFGVLRVLGFRRLFWG